MIDYRFMLEFPKVTLSLTSIMSSVCHCYPQLMALSSCMKKRFGSVSFKQKYGEEKSLNFFRKILLFKYLWIQIDSFCFDLNEGIHRLNHKIKNSQSSIEHVPSSRWRSCKLSRCRGNLKVNLKMNTIIQNVQKITLCTLSWNFTLGTVCIILNTFDR